MKTRSPEEHFDKGIKYFIVRTIVASVLAIVLVTIGYKVLRANKKIEQVAQPNQSVKPLLNQSVQTKTANSNGPQLGINVIWYTTSADNSSSEIATRANALVQRIVGLGANSISINFPYYTASPESNRLFRGSGTPTPAQLKIFIHIAQRYNMRVTLRPILNTTNFAPGQWSATLQPSNTQKWFNNLISLYDPYLQMAQANGVKTFIIGSELTSMQSNHDWIQLIQTVKYTYKGQLIYAANWNAFSQGQSSPPVDTAVDAYFPLQASNSASVASLSQQLSIWFNQSSNYYDLHKVVISELGISALNNMYYRPWHHIIVPPNFSNWNYNTQSNLFTAACNVFKQDHLAGIYFWPMSFHPPTPSQIGGIDTVTLGAPTYTAIRSCFQNG